MSLLSLASCDRTLARSARGIEQASQAGPFPVPTATHSAHNWASRAHPDRPGCSPARCFVIPAVASHCGPDAFFRLVPSLRAALIPHGQEPAVLLGIRAGP
jgi:hypothetical protein